MALALLVGVGVLVSSGDTSSTTRNAALVVATPCTKPGQVTKVAKQAVVCAALLPKNIWYPVFQEKKWICAKLGITRKQNGIFSVCGKNKLSKKRWFLTKPVMASSNPGLPTTDQEAFIKLTTNPKLIVETSPTTPLALAATTETTLTPTTETTLAPTTETTLAATTEMPTSTTSTTTTPTVAPTTPVTIALTCATGGTCKLRDIGPGGGIVFYVATTPFTCGEDLKATCTYLEAAIADGTAPSTWSTTTQAQWGCNSTSTGATATAIGTGKANTATIRAECTTPGIAADVANKYYTSTAAAGQWYLPSRKELDALCNEFFKGGSGSSSSYDSCRGTGKSGVVTSATNVTPSWSFASGSYGSSSERNEYNAWIQSFDTGFQGSGSKSSAATTRGSSYYVRPVRAF